MLFILLLAGAVLPLALAPGLLFHFDVSPKTVVLGIGAAAALLRIGAIPKEIAALWSRSGGRALILLAALQALWLCVAAVFSVRPEFSVFGSTWRQFGLLTVIPMLALVVLIAGHFCLYPERIGLFLRILAVAGIVASIYGIAQYFDFDPFQPSSSYHAHAGDSVIVRPPGTLGHADYYAWWLAVEFFCGLAIVRTDSRGWRAIGISCAISTGLATLLTGTRAALFAIGVGALALAFLSKPGIGRKHFATAALIFVALIGFFFSPAGARLRARAAWSGDEPAGGARPLLWRDTLRMSVAKPVFGFGPETFQSAFGVWQSEDLARLYPDFHHESPHNVALDALASQGIPGLMLALAWATLAGSAARRVLRTRPLLATPLTAALIASFTASLFDAAVLGPVLLTLLVMAVLIAIEPAAPGRQVVARQWMMAVVCGMLAAGTSVYTVAVAGGDFELARLQRAQGKANIDLRWQMPATAEDIYRSRILLNRCQPAAGLIVRIECWREAEQVAARATRTAGDTANAWYNLAFFTAAQNDARGTEMALGRAIGIAPEWFKPHWALAKVLAQTGERKRAAAEAERAVVLDADHDPEVAQTAREIRSGQRSF